MDPYAAAQTQTYQPTQTPSSTTTTTTSSSQIQSDPYIYSQQQSYDPSQYAAYYQQYDQSQQYYDPQSYYQTAPPEQPQPEQTQQQEHVPIHPPGVPVQPDPNQYTDPYYQTDPNAAAYYQTDPNAAYYYAQPQTQLQTPQVAQQQPVSYSDPGVVVPPGQQPWQHYQAQAGDYGLASVYPPLK